MHEFSRPQIFYKHLQSQVVTTPNEKTAQRNA